MNPALLVLFTTTQLSIATFLPQSWSGDYRTALDLARSQGLPLVVMLEDGAVEWSQSANLSDPATVAMLARCQVCRVDVSTPCGKQIAMAFGATSFPYTVLCERDGKSIVCRLAGWQAARTWHNSIAKVASNEFAGDALRGAAESVVNGPAPADDSAGTKAESGKFKLIVATMPNCAYCDRLKQETLAAPEVEDILKEFDVQTVDRSVHPELLEGFSISIYPSLVVVSPEGAPLGKITGFVPAESLSRQLRSVLQPGS